VLARDLSRGVMVGFGRDLPLRGTMGPVLGSVWRELKAWFRRVIFAKNPLGPICLLDPETG